MQPKHPEPSLDRFIFFSGSSLLIAVVVPIILFPEAAAAAINQIFSFLTVELGILYVLAAIGTLTVLLVLAFSSLGKIRFGSNPPPYSRFSWIAMLFCCGIGASVIYWGAAEWVFYYESPPFGVDPRSDEAVIWASTYGMYHWGPVGWALYCLPAIAIGCSYHVRQKPSLKLSDACEPVMGNWSGRWPGRVIDILFIIGLIGTASTGLALGTSIVASAITRATGLEDGFSMQLMIVALATATIAYSVYRGLDEGIKVLSLINAVMALILIAFVLLTGPTRFILEMGVVSVGHLMQNFIKMTTWADPLQRATFVESWTVFYWAWWLALGPFVGMFVCKISEGRTVREVIFGMLGWGSLGCALFFIVLGNYAYFLETTGVLPLIEETMQVSPSAAIASMMTTLPMGTFWLIFLAVIGLIGTATTYDSASYTLAAGATRNLTEQAHPARWHRVFWALALGVLPACLLYLGGIRVLQTASVVASIPLLGVYILMAVSIFKTLNAHADGKITFEGDPNP